MSLFWSEDGHEFCKPTCARSPIRLTREEWDEIAKTAGERPGPSALAHAAVRYFGMAQGCTNDELVAAIERKRAAAVK